MNDSVRFLKAFIERPVTTGAIAPSSRFLAARMVAGMGLSDARTVVELGPGTGSLTRAILDRIGPQTLLIAVELNPRFAAALRAALPARVVVVNESGERLAAILAAQGRTEADAIVSGIPWAGLRSDLQARLMAAAVSVLRPGGRFSTFAYIHAAFLPAGLRLRRLLRSRFRRFETSACVWRNLPPALVYRCEK